VIPFRLLEGAEAGEIQFVTKPHGLIEMEGNPFQCNSVFLFVNFHRCASSLSQITQKSAR
jgi:hypothetical protein